jgi:hypothetical protein
MSKLKGVAKETEALGNFRAEHSALVKNTDKNSVYLSLVISFLYLMG